MNDTWTATNSDFNVAFNAILSQAKHHGVDTLNENTRKFIEHQANVQANWAAQTRFLQNTIHSMTERKL